MTDHQGFCEGCHGCKEPCGRKYPLSRRDIEVMVNIHFTLIHNRNVSTCDDSDQLMLHFIDVLSILGIGINRYE